MVHGCGEDRRSNQRDSRGIPINVEADFELAQQHTRKQIGKHHAHRTGKQAAPNRRRAHSCLDRSTPRKDNLVGSRRVLQFLERHGRVLVWKRVLSRVRFDR